MGTSLWIVYTTDMPSYAATGDKYVRLNGASQTWVNRFLRTTRATSGPSSEAATAVAGPTSGIEVQGTYQIYLHVSPPLAADVTISGTIACNVWAYQDSMATNATVGVRIMRMAAATGALTEVGKGTYGTELTTASAVCTFNITPTSTAFYRGDRIVAVPYFDDYTGGTMAAGSLTFRHSATSAGVDGDSYITFTETLSFESAPAGTYIYPTNTALGTEINGQAVEKEAWTSRGGGVQSALTYCPSGWSPAVPIASSSTRIGSASTTGLQAFGDTTTDKVAQSFTTPSGSPYIYELRLNFGVDASGSPTDDVVLEIQADSGGAPSGTALASVTIPNAVAGQVGTGFKQAYLASPLSVSPSTTYWMVARRSGAASATNYWKARYYATSSSYAGGAFYKYASGSWSAVNYDATFWMYWTGYLEWYTKRLQATTLAGPVLVNYRGKVATSNAPGAIPRCEIAVVNNDGTGVTVWGVGGSAVRHATTENALQFWVQGDDLSITDGQRIRIRFLFDDSSGGGDYDLPMDDSTEHTFYYAGSSGATGDTYLRFSSGVSFTEYSGGTTVPGSFTANAVINKTITPTGFTLDALRLAPSGTKTFSLDAQIYHPNMPGDFDVDAWIASTTSGFFNVNAVRLKPDQPGSFTANAVVLASSGTKTFTLAAWLAGTFTLDALLLGTVAPTGFTLQAWIVSPTRTFTVDAVIKTRRLFGTDVVYPTPLRPAYRDGGAFLYEYENVFTGTDLYFAYAPSQSGVFTSSEAYGQWLGSYWSVFGTHQQFWAWKPLVVYPGWTILSTAAEAWGLADGSSISFSLEAYQEAWYPPQYPSIQKVGSAEYKTSAWAQTHTVLATFNTDNFVVGAWNRFSGDLTSILGTTMNGGAKTELIILSDHFRQRILAGGNEYVAFDSYPEATMPRLAVTVSANTGFTLDAILKPVHHLTVDAWVGAVGVRYRNFTASAQIRGTPTSSFTVNAQIKSPGKGNFTLDAVIKTTFLVGTDFRVLTALSGGDNYTSISLGSTVYATLLASDLNNDLFDGLASGWDEIGQRRDPDWPIPATTNYINGEVGIRWAQIPKRAGETWSSPVLKMCFGEDNSSTDFTIEARYRQWQGAVSPYTDYAKQTDFAALPLLASLATSGGISLIPTYNTFTSDANLLTYLATEGIVGTMGVTLGSSRFRLGSGIAVGGEYVVFDSYIPFTSYLPKIEISGSRGTGITLNAELRPDWHFHLDAWIAALGTKYGSFQAYATLYKKMSGTFTLDAYKAFRITLDAYIAPHFHLDAIKLKPWTKTFTLNAEMVPNRLTLDAILLSGSRGLFQLYALIARNAITLDAVLGPGGLFTVNAVLNGTRPSSFTLDALLFNGTWLRQTTLDALIVASHWRVFSANAQIERVITTTTGAVPVDAVCSESFSATATIDAVIDSGLRPGSFTVNADILGGSEQRGTFTLDAIAGATGRGLFSVSALIAQGWFRLDAQLGPRFTLDAQFKATLSGTFTLDAWITGSFTVDAILAVYGSSWAWGGSFTVSSIIADANGAWPGREVAFSVSALIVAPAGPQVPFTVDALVNGVHGDSFTLDAWTGKGFLVDAFIQPYFTLDAHILGNDYILWPDDGGPAEDPDGNPLPAWFKASRKYRVNITLDGTDVTEDVIWARTSFTQNAKTNPGTFELTLKGVHAWNGGEEIQVTLDDFRTFGGYVLSVERSYVFGEDAGDTVTVLRGADYNVLLDRLIVYNKASADDGRGSYTNWKTFKVGTLDTTIIHKVFSSYVDLPPGFDYETYVESVGIAALEKPWAMPQPGSPVRQVLQSISRSTNGIWYVDPYLHLHYGSRTTVTAPYPITDGLGGISSQSLSYQADMSMLVTEARLWGTLAYTVEGEVMTRSRQSAWYDLVGPWQHGEFRSDLHHQSFINRRVDSIIERYGQPIERAKVAIFDPGYQAGQVAQVKLTEHGIDEVLPIRSLALTFAVAKEPKDGYYYCVPRYELSVGMDPEEPWDIYDYLPFPDDKGTPYEPRHRRDEEECLITDSFARDDMANGWGTSNAQIDWVVAYGEPEWFSVHDQTGRILLPASTEQWNGNYGDVKLPFSPQQGESFDLSFDLTIVEMTGEYSYIYASWGGSEFGIDIEEGTIGFWLDGSDYVAGIDIRFGVTYHVTWTCMAACYERIAFVPLSDDTSIPGFVTERENVNNGRGWVSAFWMGAGNESLTGQLDVRFTNIDIRAMGVSPCEVVIGTDNYLTREGSAYFHDFDYNRVETYHVVTTDAAEPPVVWGGINTNAEKAYDQINIRHIPQPGFYLDPSPGTDHYWRSDFMVHPYPEGTTRAALHTVIVAYDWVGGGGGQWVLWFMYDGASGSWDTEHAPDDTPPFDASPGTYLVNNRVTRRLLTVAYDQTPNLIHTEPGPWQMVPINYDLVLGADGKVRFVVLLEPPERTNMYESGTATYGYMYTQHDIDSDPPATPGWNNYPPYQHYEITYYGLSNPTYAVNACLDTVEDTEGEVHGMVGQGWNVETVTVTQVVGASWTGTFETTARVTRGTVLVYDEDGRWLQPRDEWEYTSGDGQHFALLGVTSERVTVCYRAWIENIRSEYAVPRDVDPSWGPKRIPF